jgi:hypothetical protein
MKLEFSRMVFEKLSDIKFNENIFSGAELFHADGLTDRHNEANRRLSQFFIKTGRSITNMNRAYKRYKRYTNIIMLLKRKRRYFERTLYPYCVKYTSTMFFSS